MLKQKGIIIIILLVIVLLVAYVFYKRYGDGRLVENFTTCPSTNDWGKCDQAGCILGMESGSTSYECRPPVCNDYNYDSSKCTNLGGCTYKTIDYIHSYEVSPGTTQSWTNEKKVCFEGDASSEIPCSSYKYTSEDACPSDRCTWCSDSSSCVDSVDPSAVVPCYDFNDQNKCEQVGGKCGGAGRCNWCNDISSCVEKDKVLPCNRFYGKENACTASGLCGGGDRCEYIPRVFQSSADSTRTENYCLENDKPNPCYTFNNENMCVYTSGNKGGEGRCEWTTYQSGDWTGGNCNKIRQCSDLSQGECVAETNDCEYITNQSGNNECRTRVGDKACSEYTMEPGGADTNTSCPERCTWDTKAAQCSARCDTITEQSQCISDNDCEWDTTANECDNKPFYSENCGDYNDPNDTFIPPDQQCPVDRCKWQPIDTAGQPGKCIQPPDPASTSTSTGTTSAGTTTAGTTAAGTTAAGTTAAGTTAAGTTAAGTTAAGTTAAGGTELLDRVMDLINLILEGYSNYERFYTYESRYEHFTSDIPLTKLSISKDLLSRIFNKRGKIQTTYKDKIYPSESIPWVNNDEIPSNAPSAISSLKNILTGKLMIMKCNEFLEKLGEHYVWNADKFEDVFEYSGDVDAGKDYHISNNPIDGSLSTNKDKLLSKITFIIGFYNNAVIGDVANQYFNNEQKKKFYDDLKNSVNRLLCNLRHVDNIPHPKNTSNVMCGGFGDSIYFSVDYNDKYEFSIVNKTPTCDFSCPTTMAGTPSIANASNNVLFTSLQESSSQNNNLSAEYLENCRFRPRGFSQAGCVRLCMADTEINGCDYHKCDTKCELCADENNCRWLLDSEMFKKSNQSCTFNATNSPFRLGETERECVSACRNNRNDFGGNNCTTDICRQSCANCEDPIKCPWTVKPTVSPESITAPSQPIITGIPGNRKITISWKRPFSGNSDITKYVIMAFETNDHGSGLSVEVLENNLFMSRDTYKYTITGLTNNKYYTVGIAALNVKGMSIMSNSIDLKPYNVDIPDQITEAEQIQAAASMKIKENSELTQNIIKQMILNKEKLSESMVEDINRRAEQEVVARNMGEAPVHNALAFLEGKDFNIEISS